MDKDLSSEIIKMIKAEGPLTFAEFMAQALYHPRLGYYNKPKVKIGRAGDYYTSPGVHAAFGGCLAKQFWEMWHVLGQPEVFSLIEFGPGDGQLAKDILDYISDHYPVFYQAIRYHLVEISPYHRDLQFDKLQGHLNVFWPDSSTLGKGEHLGCIFSNEFVDALPVHRVVYDGNLKELYVTVEGTGFGELLGGLSKPELQSYLDEQNILLEDKQELEINLAALQWLELAAASLKRGFVLTVDYGYQAAELAMPQLQRGTLVCYYKHQVVNSPYQNVGEQDITSHVNFTALQHFGGKFNLNTVGLTTQMKFLVGLGILQLPDNPTQSYVERQKALLAIKRLIMPQGMGESFRVLIQYKGPQETFVLQGLQDF